MRTMWSFVAVVFLASCCAPAAQQGDTTTATPPEPPQDPVAEQAQPPEPTPAVAQVEPKKGPYPPTPREDIVETIHGERVADPYRWLEDPTKPETAAWMDAQDAVARTHIANLPRREKLAARLRDVFYFDALSAPIHRRGRYFFSRKHADKEKSVVYWKTGKAGAERVLLDPNTWSTDGSAGLGGWWPSRDGKYVAFAKKLNNSDEAVMHVLDVSRGTETGDVIPGTKYSGASWTPDGKGFYYVWVPPVGGKVTVADRPGFAELRYHKLGADPAKDPIVHPATGNPQTFLGGGVSWDGRWLFAVVRHGWNQTDVYFKDLKRGGATAEWTPLAVGMKAIFEVYAWRDNFYVLTNLDAPRYRVLEVDPRKAMRAEWKEIVPESDATLEKVNIVGDRLVLTYLRNAASELAVHDLGGKRVRTLALPSIGTVGGMTGNPDEDTGYFVFTSFTEPTVTFETSIKAGGMKEWSRVKLPIDLSQYVTEQVRYPSKDGTEITMFLIHHKDAKPDGKQPVLLYGYGGFNVSVTPAFSSSRAVWLEQGGVLAMPNLRGGGEYGEDWHKAGMGANKQNVFDDYVAAARWLIANKWTTPERLAIHGGSNGGLLVGAAMTQAPELFRAVVCSVPLLDMVRYHLFGSGKTWIPEYGSAEDPAQFKTLFAYSPYHHVREGVTYPALLMMSADHDDRVDPMHARKFIAAVQHANTGDRPALLRIEKNAGHGGADVVKQQVDMNADMYAFLMDQLGM